MSDHSGLAGLTVLVDPVDGIVIIVVIELPDLGFYEDVV